MKRSTLIFSVLLAVLFVAPFVVAGSFYFFGSEPAVIIDKHFPVVRIDNPSLQTEDVVLSTDPADYGTLRSFSVKEYRALYYKGEKTYLPEVREQGDTLFVGPPREMEAEADDLPLLYVPAGRADTIYLNGKVIFNR
jgi:hypothetical protein